LISSTGGGLIGRRRGVIRSAWLRIGRGVIGPCAGKDGGGSAQGRIRPPLFNYEFMRTDGRAAGVIGRGVIGPCAGTGAARIGRKMAGRASGCSALSWLPAVRLLAAGLRTKPLPLVAFAERFPADRADGGKKTFQSGF